MSFSGMTPLRYIQNHYIIFPSRRYLSTHASDLQFRYITLSSVHVYLILLILELYHFYHLLIFRIISLAVFPMNSSYRSLRHHWDTFVSSLSNYCLPVDFILLLCIFFLRRFRPRASQISSSASPSLSVSKSSSGTDQNLRPIPTRSMDSWSCRDERVWGPIR